MQELLLVRYGEIFLKGLNRPYFIRALVRKIRYAVKDLGAEVWVHDGRIFVRGFSDLDTCITSHLDILQIPDKLFNSHICHIDNDKYILSPFRKGALPGRLWLLTLPTP